MYLPILLLLLESLQKEKVKPDYISFPILSFFITIINIIVTIFMSINTTINTTIVGGDAVENFRWE